MVFQNNVLSGAAGSGTTVHAINQSIRFNAADSPYMARTFGTPTNAKKWTLSAWVKLHGKTDGSSGGVRLLEAGGSAGSEDLISIGSGYLGYSNIYFWSRTSSSYDWRLQTTAEYRDPSAWMHLVFVFDSNNTLSVDRMKIFVNGERITNFQQESYPSSGDASRINTAVAHRIGAPVYSSYYSEGYHSEMVFIDGQALTCDSFGEFNSSGIWIPKDVSGLTFGNNGYHIDGRDASDLGDDESGNGNDFSTSGLAAHDQVFDTPTNNFPTLNPLAWGIRNAANSVPLSEGNLKFTGSNSIGVYGTYNATVQVPSSGGWYFEMRVTSIGSVAKDDMYLYVAGINFFGDGSVTGSGSYGSAWSAGDILGVAVNATGIWLSINGTYQNSGNPATGSNSAGTPSTTSREIITGDGSATTNSSLSGILNFGQDSTFAGATSAGGNSDASGIGNFKYSVPSGFKALCTKNMGA